MQFFFIPVPCNTSVQDKENNDGKLKFRNEIARGIATEAVRQVRPRFL